MFAARALGLATVAALLAACAGPGQPASDPDAALLLDSVAGYSRAVDVPLDLDHASKVGPADPRAASPALRSAGYRGGWSRVWTQGDAYVVDTVFAVSTPVDAASLAAFETGGVASGSSFRTDSPPGTTVASFFGHTRDGKREVFCEAAAFPVGDRSFLVVDCQPAPRDPEIVLGRARAQRDRAARLLGAT